jgi:hypothetical protein
MSIYNKMLIVQTAVLVFVLAANLALDRKHMAVAGYCCIGSKFSRNPRSSKLFRQNELWPWHHHRPEREKSSILRGSKQNDEKFGLRQRFASVQCLVLGATVGSLSQAPVSLLHDVVFHAGGLAQWEYDTDMAAITGGLFAIVYRYCIREDTSNPQLNQGVISALILTRTLPQVQIPSYCQAVPLNCADAPLYILDGNVLQQLVWCGLESWFLFTGTAMAMDMAMEKGYIIRFPG